MSSKLFIFAICVAMKQPLIHAQIFIGPEQLRLNDSITSNRIGDIVLGGLFPIHQNQEGRCGTILDLGIQRAEAMVLAINLINNRTDLLPGITLGFEIRDTCVITNKALDESLYFLSVGSQRTRDAIGISGVVGAAASSVSIAIANLLRLFHIPQISYASTSKVLSDKSRYDYFLRTVPPDLLQAEAMAAIAHHFNWTYVSVVSTEGAYGVNGIEAFIEKYTEITNESSISRCISANIRLTREASPEDYDEAIDQLLQPVLRNATVVVLFGQLATAEGLMEAIIRRRASDPSFQNATFTWIASDAWGDSLSPTYYDIAEGLISITPQYNLSSEFDSYFTSLNPQNYTANPWFAEYWQFMFDCTFEFNSSSNATVCDPSSQSLLDREAQYQQNSKVTFTMDAVFAFAHALDKIIKDHCNSMYLCREIFDSSGKINGQLLLSYLREVSFPGYSDEVISFDENYDRNAGYRIQNLVRNSNGSHFYSQVGHWKDGVLDLDEEQTFFWAGQRSDPPFSYCSESCNFGEFPELIPGHAHCCWNCVPCQGSKQVSDGVTCKTCPPGYIPNSLKSNCEAIPPDHLSWIHPWAIIIVILSICGLTETVVIIIIFIVYRQSKIVKASSRELSSIILTGIGLCYILPFFYIGYSNAVSCAITRAGLGLCFSICFGALLVKTNRIHRIFNRKEASLKPPNLISPQSQVLLVGCIVFFQVVIAVVWLVLEKPGVTLVTAEYSAEIRCAANVYVGLSVSLAYNCILLICCTYFAFRTRKIPSDFNETKLINLTCYTMCVIWMAFIPSYFGTAGLGSVYTSSSQILAIFLSATAILNILFLPKVYMLFFKKKLKELTESKSDHRQLSIASSHLMQSNNFSSSSVNTVGRRPSYSFCGKQLQAMRLCTYI